MNQKNKRFVVQQHTKGRDVHWDFMLESGNTLQTYRLDKAPNEVLHHPTNAIKIFDHPLKFLTYEGPVNRGKGNVCIIEAGIYQIKHREHNRIELTLSGKILKGKFFLTHTEGNKWQFTADSQVQRR